MVNLTADGWLSVFFVAWYWRSKPVSWMRRKMVCSSPSGGADLAVSAMQLKWQDGNRVPFAATLTSYYRNFRSGQICQGASRAILESTPAAASVNRVPCLRYQGVLIGRSGRVEARHSEGGRWHAFTRLLLHANGRPYALGLMIALSRTGPRILALHGCALGPEMQSAKKRQRQLYMGCIEGRALSLQIAFVDHGVLAAAHLPSM